MVSDPDCEAGYFLYLHYKFESHEYGAMYIHSENIVKNRESPHIGPVRQDNTEANKRQGLITI